MIKIYETKIMVGFSTRWMLTGIIEQMSEHKTGFCSIYEAASCMESFSKAKSIPAGKFKEIMIMY